MHNAYFSGKEVKHIVTTVIRDLLSFKGNRAESLPSLVNRKTKLAKNVANRIIPLGNYKTSIADGGSPFSKRTASLFTVSLGRD